MIETKEIRSIAEGILAGGLGEAASADELFVVDVKVSSTNDIEILVDSDRSVAISQCIALSRAIEESLDREQEDFSLTVASAGIGSPIKVFRQYAKLTGKPVEVILKNGTKVTAVLKQATDEGITLLWEEKAVVEGEKKKRLVEREATFGFDEIKSTVEHLDFR